MKDDFILYYTYRVHEQRLLNQQQKIYSTGQARDQTGTKARAIIQDSSQSVLFSRRHC